MASSWFISFEGNEFQLNLQVSNAQKNIVEIRQITFEMWPVKFPISSKPL